jgi:hypothetical protein
MWRRCFVRLEQPSPTGRWLGSIREWGDTSAEIPGLCLCAAARAIAPARSLENGDNGQGNYLYTAPSSLPAQPKFLYECLYFTHAARARHNMSNVQNMPRVQTQQDPKLTFAHPLITYIRVSQHR